MKKTLLLIIAVASVSFASAQCTELFFSEYVESSGNSKALEIYNPTQNPINLSAYAIKRYSNGANTPVSSMTLSGTIAAGDVVVITNGQTDSLYVGTPPSGYWSIPIDPVLYAMGDLHDGLYPAVCYFNGNDALTIEKGAAIIDIFGKVGEDPGTAWTNDITSGYTSAGNGTWLTINKTLIRKSTVKKGVTTNPALFNTFLEYDTLPGGTYSYLGSHVCDCHPAGGIQNLTDNKHSVVLYPNPVINETFMVSGDDNIYSVEILDILGKSVYTDVMKSKKSEAKINTQGINSGLYIVKVTFADNKYLYQKILIK
ncbi:MAG: lamin tail domain-containing protein [Saprospiraceae bacterium]|nr:lamin tail domain-containing protein [Saprospiraceae bacterium]